jgi:hypothetical protein
MFMLCKTWMCGRCRDWLKKRWDEHLVECFLGAKQLYVVVCTRPEWDSRVDRQIRRKNGRDGGYARFNLRDGDLVDELFVVISTAPVGDPITIDGATHLVRELLPVLPAVKRAVSTSRTWKLPVITKTKEWERVAFCNTRKADDIRQVLNEFGITFGAEHELKAGRWNRASTGTSVVEFTVPEDLSPWTRLVFMGKLAGAGAESNADDDVAAA